MDYPNEKGRTTAAMDVLPIYNNKQVVPPLTLLFIANLFWKLQLLYGWARIRCVRLKKTRKTNQDAFPPCSPQAKHEA